MHAYGHLFIHHGGITLPVPLASTLPQASNKLEQIQHRLMSFDELWPPLRRWYLRFRNLSTVNSSFDVEKVYDTARDKIQEVINKVRYLLSHNIHVLYYLYHIHVHFLILFLNSACSLHPQSKQAEAMKRLGLQGDGRQLVGVSLHGRVQHNYDTFHPSKYGRFTYIHLPFPPPPVSMIF